MKKDTVFKWLFYPLSLLAALLVLMPASTDISLLFSGVLIAWYTARYGVGYTAFALPLLFAVGYFANGLPTASLLGGQSLCAYVIGFFLHKRKSFSLMLIVSTLVETAVLTGFTLYICNMQQCTPTELLFNRPLQQFRDALLSSGVQMTAEMAAEMPQMMEFLSQMLQTSLPFLYLSASLAYVYLVFGIARFCLKKQGILIDTMPYFHELRMPGSVSGIFVLLFVAAMFSGSAVLSNVSTFMFMLHMMCGVSALDAFLLKKGIPKGIRIILLAFILLISSFLGGIFMAVLCFMGMSGDVQSVRK